MTDTAQQVDSQHDAIIAQYERVKHDLGIFMEGVVKYIGEHPDLIRTGHRIVHSYKSRLKDNDHLREKIKRKIAMGKTVTADNLFSFITDLAGVRILHLFQENFADIDAVIRKKVTDGDWIFAERPKAYTWDPEAVIFFNNFDLDVSEKSTSYTSVHYLIRPRADSPLCCEVQVRTLFEEIWGEVDHQINYPMPTDNIACREQIKVLSKIVGAGSRLLDSLKRVQQT
ncbi:RelA/SpoT domain-containing protein [Mesorhizobium sp. B1-1-5]|uniref:RelA/SpoT domain-containing protein n=1 Tax=Mesorhizobium sp. B1-1-5 TaxID=2589979 RepID=UPI001128202D|nr:RelA/SpoT domain-containing protein [Mesorhizobium sp. B1-1-5]TPO01711.1 (p)ppGpp synthetase [Mesorhizobium sp. B1-1-5]